MICCPIYHWLSVSRQWIYHSRFALVIYPLHDWPPTSDILGNKSLLARIYFLNVGFLCLRCWLVQHSFLIWNVYCSFICELKYQVWVCVFLVRTKGTFWYQNCLPLLNFLFCTIYLWPFHVQTERREGVIRKTIRWWYVRKRIHHWCSVSTGKSKHLGPHCSTGELGKLRFPLERTVDPWIGIFLSPLIINDGFYLSYF